MDPIMWDPFRYKLGGRLLNKDMQEFTDRYGVPEDGKYVITRDVGTHAILKETEAGRGSPHGGAYLSFQHVPAEKLREAFGPVIDRLAANGIDLTRMPVEVAPIAHYHMGGVTADVKMQTELPGLLVAGEAVGGANGANRLSGNAITEAFVFGREAGRTAAARVKAMKSAAAPGNAARATVDLIRSEPPKDAPNSAAMLQRLQATMSDDVGPLRTKDRLDRALDTIGELTTALGERPFGDAGAFDMQRLDWFDLRNMLTVARAVTQAASLRTESRGAHQREDFPEMLPQWRVNQVIRLRGQSLDFTQTPASPVDASLEVAAQ
jgi:succinate dehydrogenase/fumarate reductase flavoprotein subunit